MAEEKKEEKKEAAKPAASGGGGDSKLWAALCYVLPLLMGIVVLLTDKKNDKFVLFHAWQSILSSIGIWAVMFVFAFVTLGFGAVCMPVVWLGFLWLGYRAYQGERFLLPVFGEYAEKQMK